MSLQIKTALCALAASVAAPVVYLFVCCALDDWVTALGAFVRSDSGASETQRYGGAFALVFVVMPVLALLGAMSAALVWRGDWSLLSKRWCNGICAILCGLCVVPLAYVAPMMTESNLAMRAVPPASSTNSLVHWIVNSESWSPTMWAVVLCARCVWSWKAERPK